MSTAIDRTDQDLFSIQGVQIFRSGKWNGDDYALDDLDAMVDAATEVAFGVPIKAGHTDEGGKPALGWVENLRRVGDSLYADLVALPKKVYDAIKSRGYDAVSAEIYWDLDRNGKKFPRVLKALALLGAEIPAVDLQPLRAFLSVMPDLPASRFAVYGVELGLPKAGPTVATIRVDPVETEAVIQLKQLSEAPMEPETKEHAEMMDPDADGNCRPGYVKGGDGKCHLKSSDNAQETPPKEPATMATEVKDGEIIVSLSEVNEWKRKAAQAERISILEAELQQKNAESAEFVDKQREGAIRAKIREVKIPAFRSFVKVFYDMALRHTPEAKMYSLLDPKITMTPEEVVDSFVAAVNKQADVLFKTLSVDTKPADPNEPDKVQERIEYRVSEYVRHNKLDRAKDYKQALKAVLDADPELKEAYIRS